HYHLWQSTSGSFSQTITGGVITGNRTDTTDHLSTYNYATNSALGADGQWTTTGNRTDTVTDSENSSYSGSGSYTISTSSSGYTSTISGVAGVDGHTKTGYTYSASSVWD